MLLHVLKDSQSEGRSKSFPFCKTEEPQQSLVQPSGTFWEHDVGVCVYWKAFALRSTFYSRVCVLLLRVSLISKNTPYECIIYI